MGTGILVAILVMIAIILTALHLAVKNTILRTVLVLIIGLAICIVIHTTPSVVLGMMLIACEIITNAIIKKVVEMRTPPAADQND